MMGKGYGIGKVESWELRVGSWGKMLRKQARL